MLHSTFQHNEELQLRTEPLSYVPEDVIITILSFLPAEDLVRVSMVSKKFYRLCESDRLWEPLSSQSSPDGINNSGPITKDYISSWKQYLAAAFQIPDQIKIVVLGSSGVGKTASIIKYVQGVFVDTHEAMIEESYIRIVTFGGKNCKIEFFDSSGTDRYKAIRDLYMRKGHAFLLVFSVTDESTFLGIESCVEQVTKIREEDVRSIPFVLVGNKADSEKRKVSIDQAKALAAKFYCPYIETSAKSNLNIEKVFHEACYIYIQRCRAASKPTHHLSELLMRPY